MIISHWFFTLKSQFFSDLKIWRPQDLNWSMNLNDHHCWPTKTIRNSNRDSSSSSSIGRFFTIKIVATRRGQFLTNSIFLKSLKRILFGRLVDIFHLPEFPEARSSQVEDPFRLSNEIDTVSLKAFLLTTSDKLANSVNRFWQNAFVLAMCLETLTCAVRD